MKRRLVKLARAIDREAERWLGGLEVLFSADELRLLEETLTVREHREIQSRLAEHDALERELRECLKRTPERGRKRVIGRAA